MLMSSPQELMAHEQIRPLKRVEYEALVKAGHLEDERVELLFGVVVAMTPTDPDHSASVSRVNIQLARQLGARAAVRVQSPFAASDISEPEPDVFIVEPGDPWGAHPDRAFLVVEVARSSRSRDRGIKARLYGLAEVDEYWIVDHEKGVVEVYRDRRDGRWQTMTTHARGETIAMVAFPDVQLIVSEVLPPDAG